MLHLGSTLVRSSQAEQQALDSGYMTQIKTDTFICDRNTSVGIYVIFPTIQQSASQYELVLLKTVVKQLPILYHAILSFS